MTVIDWIVIYVLLAALGHFIVGGCMWFVRWTTHLPKSSFEPSVFLDGHRRAFGHGGALHVRLRSRRVVHRRLGRVQSALRCVG